MHYASKMYMGKTIEGFSGAGRFWGCVQSCENATFQSGTGRDCTVATRAFSAHRTAFHSIVDEGVVSLETCLWEACAVASL
jgi:hypothetical protein